MVKEGLNRSQQAPGPIVDHAGRSRAQREGPDGACIR
jgi:hypothetical protein